VVKLLWGIKNQRGNTGQHFQRIGTTTRHLKTMVGQLNLTFTQGLKDKGEKIGFSNLFMI